MFQIYLRSPNTEIRYCMRYVTFKDYERIINGHSNEYIGTRITGIVIFEVYCIESSIENPKIYKDEINFEIEGFVRFINGSIHDIELVIEKTNLPSYILENREFIEEIYELLEEEIEGRKD